MRLGDGMRLLWRLDVDASEVGACVGDGRGGDGARGRFRLTRVAGGLDAVAEAIWAGVRRLALGAAEGVARVGEMRVWEHARRRFGLALVAGAHGAGAETSWADELLAAAAGCDGGAAERVAGTWIPRACSARNARQRVVKSSYHPRE